MEDYKYLMMREQAYRNWIYKYIKDYEDRKLTEEDVIDIIDILRDVYLMREVN